MHQSKLIPQVSFKGVFVFGLLLFLGVSLLPKLLKFLPMSTLINYFLSTGISASIGLILISTMIDAKEEDKPFFRKRIILSTIVGFASSGLIIILFGSELIGG